MTNMNIGMGRLLSKWRQEAGLSQALLADALGTQQATVSKLESGIYKASVEQLLGWLCACGLKLSDVAQDIDEELESGVKPLWERINE